MGRWARMLVVVAMIGGAVIGVGRVSGADAVDQDVVFIATGENFPDALGVGAVAALHNAPVLFVLKDVIPAATLNELNRLQPARIVIVGGVGVVTDTVAAALGGLAFSPVVERIAGPDRFATAAAVSGYRFPAALDADTLGGLSAAAFLEATAKAVDADMLDGADSTAFVRKAELVQPFSVYDQGAQTLDVGPADVLVRSVTLNIPAAGVVVANSTLRADTPWGAWIRCSITTGDEVDLDFLQSWRSPAADHWSQVAGTRGFDVGAGTAVTINLVCNTAPLATSSVAGAALTATYTANP